MEGCPDCADSGGDDPPGSNSPATVAASAAPWLAKVSVPQCFEPGTSEDNEPKVSCSSFISRFLKQVYGGMGLPALHVFTASQYFPACDRTDRAIFVAEQQENGDLLLAFGLYVEEHGDAAERPRSNYIQYLEKTGFGAARKPSLITATLVAYMSFVSTIRPCQTHLWADPPDEDYPDFIFYDSHKNLPVTTQAKSDDDLTSMYKYIARQGGWTYVPYVYSVTVPAMPVFNLEETRHDWHHADVKSKPHVKDMIEQLKKQVAALTAAINSELNTTLIIDHPQRYPARDATPCVMVPPFMIRYNVLVESLPFDGIDNARDSSARLITMMRATPYTQSACTAELVEPEEMSAVSPPLATAQYESASLAVFAATGLLAAASSLSFASWRTALDVADAVEALVAPGQRMVVDARPRALSYDDTCRAVPDVDVTLRSPSQYLLSYPALADVF